MIVPQIRELPPEQALDLARSSATLARRAAAEADEKFAEAITIYNQAGGEFRVHRQPA
jgi:homoserine acetyltransferase